MGVPLLLLLATHHLDLLAFAAFGGFTSLYARNEPYPLRAKLLAVTAVTLVVAVAAGTSVAAFSDSIVASSIVVALVAGLTKLVSDAVRTGPPGGLMPTFACAVCAELPLQPHDVGTAVAIAAAAAAWSWLVCMSGSVVRPHGPERVAVARALEAAAARSASVGTEAEPRARHGAAVAIQRAWQAVGAGRSTSRRARLEALVARAETAMNDARQASDTGIDPPAGADAELRDLAARLRRPVGIPEVPLTRDEVDEVAGMELLRQEAPRLRAAWGRLNPSAPFLPLAIRVAVAAAVAGVLAHLVGLGHTSWAAVSAVAVLQSVNLTTSVNRGIQRALGTATGVVLGVATLAFSPGPVAAVVLVILFQVLAELTVMLNYAMALVFATPLALLLAHIGAQTSTTVLVRDRMLDTLLGVVVALAAALLIPNRRLANVVRTSRAALEDSLERTRAIDGGAPAAERAAAARQTASRIYALRDSYDAAVGEPWPEDLPAEDIVRVEREAHAELARLTR
jgi:hypothetical protein